MGLSRVKRGRAHEANAQLGISRPSCDDAFVGPLRPQNNDPGLEEGGSNTVEGHTRIERHQEDQSERVGKCQELPASAWSGLVGYCEGV